MSNLIKTTKITKNLILDELTRIMIDHSILIEEEKLERKINLLFEDVKNMTAERFLANCEIIRKQELYGKLPANHKFINPDNKELVNPKIDFLNSIAGSNIFSKFEEFEQEVHLFCALGMSEKLSSLSPEIKNQIKAQFNKKITIR